MMWMIVLLPFIAQTVVVFLDEGIFHLKRGLPRWERIGHPVDTLSVIGCLVYVLFVPFSSEALKWFIALAIFSCILVTKDEFVHKEHCPASEQWLHALLFLNHPLMLGCLGVLWPVISSENPPSFLMEWKTNDSFFRLFLLVQGGAMFLFFLYQIIYWNFIYEEKPSQDQQHIL